MNRSIQETPLLLEKADFDQRYHPHLKKLSYIIPQYLGVGFWMWATVHMGAYNDEIFDEIYTSLRNNAYQDGEIVISLWDGMIKYIRRENFVETIEVLPDNPLDRHDAFNDTVEWVRSKLSSDGGYIERGMIEPIYKTRFIADILSTHNNRVIDAHVREAQRRKRKHLAIA